MSVPELKNFRCAAYRKQKSIETLYYICIRRYPSIYPPLPPKVVFIPPFVSNLGMMNYRIWIISDYTRIMNHEIIDSQNFRACGGHNQCISHCIQALNQKKSAPAAAKSMRFPLYNTSSKSQNFHACSALFQYLPHCILYKLKSNRDRL